MKNYKKAYQEFRCSSLEVWIYGRNLYIAGTSVQGEKNTQKKKSTCLSINYKYHIKKPSLVLTVLKPNIFNVVKNKQEFY